MTASEREKKILEFWDQNAIFEKSVQERPVERPYVFYDGPPFATGLPHYGHIVASLMKDIVPRYRTMKGDRVERVWGWDCHGLPIENIIEEKLSLSSKKDIEDYGVARFNEACRATVLQYAEEWKKTIRRMGRWVDMEHSYMTMDPSYMESVWWVFRQLWDRGLIYEGKKAMHICPRCVTPLSNFEVTLNYKDAKDISATVAFRVTNAHAIAETDLAILAWTTTPWTLPGNVLLAVGEDIEYAVATAGENTTQKIILAKDRVDAYREKMKDTPISIERTVRGMDLVGLTYEPLFPYYADTPNAFRVVAADFVTTEDGTGVVHIAPAFGEDDYRLGEKEGVGFVQHVTMAGTFASEVSDFAGQEVKPKEDPTRADIEIIKYLSRTDALFFKEKYEHTYPFCWRCETPLLNYATSSWFVRVTELKEQMRENNQKISWVPEHMKEGRFGKWLENARDWAISRSRFWGTPLPIWKSESGDTICVGSIAELKQLSGAEVSDLHKHIIDEVPIVKDGVIYRRIPEVLDCWFESGSMPYAQMHYPFENKEKFEAGFPAEFIAEGQDQTRGWFYTLHVLATALTRPPAPAIPVRQSEPAFRNVVVNGIVLAEDGKKMSKRLKNYPDPLDVIETYGADALRLYFAASPAMHAENLNFSESGVREVYNKVINTLFNVVSFYELFASEARSGEEGSVQRTVLDHWIFSRVGALREEVSRHLQAYRLAEAARPFVAFSADLSQWYVRRSRDRFKSDDLPERAAAISTLARVLFEVSRLLAPFAPFLAEEIHQTLRRCGGLPPDAAESVHLEEWPAADLVRDEALEQEMEAARSVVEMAHGLRAEAKIRVRQPLGMLLCSRAFSSEIARIIADEVNVEQVAYGGDRAADDQWRVREAGGIRAALSIEITPELRDAGIVREIVRRVNDLRKEAGLTPKDRIEVAYETDDEKLAALLAARAEDIQRSIGADGITRKRLEAMERIEVDASSLSIAVIRT